MTPVALPQSAPRGTKRGWKPVMGDLAPHEHAAFVALAADWGLLRTDMVREAILALLVAEGRAPAKGRLTRRQPREAPRQRRRSP